MGKRGDSSVQRCAERVILSALGRELGVELGDPPTGLGLQLDGFKNDGQCPVCVEVWAHQGAAKSGQKQKVMTDFCRLLLAESRIGKACRKIFAVCDQDAVAHLRDSWQGDFARAFGIEVHVVNIDEETRQQVRQAQKEQYR